MTGQEELTGGTVATIVVAPTLLVLSVLLAVFLFRKWRRSNDDIDRPMFLGCWIACAVGAVATVVCTWWGMFPWKYEYHHWVPISGVVETIDSRLVAMEGKFVVKFEGDDQQYGVLDTRAAGVRTGDQVTITCVRRWQWSGTHGYDCNFVSLEKGGTR